MWGGQETWENNPKAWVLLEALEAFEATLCSGCGHSAMHTLDPLNTMKFDLKTGVVCVACEAREQYTSDLMPGEKPYVVSLMSEDL